MPLWPRSASRTEHGVVKIAKDSGCTVGLPIVIAHPHSLVLIRGPCSGLGVCYELNNIFQKDTLKSLPQYPGTCPYLAIRLLQFQLVQTVLEKSGFLIWFDACPYNKGIITQTPREDSRVNTKADTGETQAQPRITSPGPPETARAEQPPRLEPWEGAQPCQQLDLRLSASRAVTA